MATFAAMGEIQRQSIRGTIFTYSGAMVGFITSSILFPRFLTTEEIGLISVMIAWAMLYDQVFGLGIANITTRVFPHFRNVEKKHHGFIGLTGLITGFGFALSIIAFFFLRDYMIESEKEKSKLFADFIHLLPFMIFSNMTFNMFDQYSKMLYHPTRGILGKELTLRLFILILITGYIFKLINFNEFIYGYVLVQVIPSLILVWLLKKDKSLHFQVDWPAYTPVLRKEIMTVGFYGLLSSATSTITLTLDRIMLNNQLDLDTVGIYSTCFFFGTLVILPSRTINKTISTYIGEAWKRNDIKEIQKIYRSSSVNQFLIGTLLLIGIWANIENIMILLKEAFRPGYWVILIIGLMYLSDMLFNSAVQVLVNSDKYRYATYFIILMTILMVVGNIIAIPLWSITGAALASLVSRLVYNLITYFYVWKQWKIQPYNLKHLLIALIGILVYYGSTFIPPFSNFIVDIVIRSSSMAIVFLGLNIALKTSDEVDRNVKKYIKVRF